MNVQATTSSIAAEQRERHYKDLGLWTDERLGFMLQSAAARWPNREFFRIGDHRLTYAAAWSESLKYCAFLESQQVGPGDKVMLVLGNCAELIPLLFATWRIGAIAVPVVPIYRVRELSAILEDCEPALIVAAAQDRSRAPYQDLEEALVAIGRDHPRKFAAGMVPAESGWQRLPEPRDLVDASLDSLPTPAAADVPTLILYTSGTTSKPKGVYCTSRAILAGLDAWPRDLGLSIHEVTFTGAPLAHLGGIFLAALLPARLGARSVILKHWDPDEAVRLIEEEKVTITAGATLFLRDVVERYEAGHSPTHRLKIFSSSGAATPPDLIHRADALGIRAYRSYGMTETFGTLAHTRLDASVHERAETDGRVVFGSEIQIVDEDRVPVPYGELGSIRLRSAQATPGYTVAALNHDQFDEDGWFYPGDLGTITADGVLTMVGRTKDIINRGGEKFSCQDIESAITSHHDIAEAAVVGKPDDRFGEVVAAFVVLKPGSGWDGPRQVESHLESIKLARQKIPVEWHVVANGFPRTASGKIQKQELLKMLTSSAGDLVARRSSRSDASA